ncbi:hypothetical protein [Nocardia vaccinii]|uniref:hypothetical protein n=1 Tax=Nocardia vaccinii TaxID=1822 RepID=UPI0008301AEE|nr:hypothetical protein [Nocardia vaccinii]
MSYSALDVREDDGIDGRIESITTDRVTVVGAWSAEAELILRPDTEVVVLTHQEYSELIELAGWRTAKEWCPPEDPDTDGKDDGKGAKA